MALITQNLPYVRAFLLVLSTDHITGATGRTPAVAISKAGSAFAAPAGAVSELGNGWYALALTAADAGTAGDLAVHATASGCDPTDWEDQVAPTAVQVQYAGPVNPTTGNVSIIQGDSYKAADGFSLDFIDSANAWPDLTSATVSFAFFFTSGAQIFTGGIPVPSGSNKKLRLELTPAQSQGMPVAPSVAFRGTVTLADGDPHTLVRGLAAVTQA